MSDEKKPGISNEEIYKQAVEDLARRDLSASENRDRAILFTSLPFLGITLGLFSLINPGKEIVCVPIFFVAAVAFVLAVICVLISCWTAMWAKNDLEPKLWEYFFHQGKEKPVTWYNQATEILNKTATICYILGIIFIFIFFYINFPSPTNS